jgi:hypothetical protein
MGQMERHAGCLRATSMTGASGLATGDNGFFIMSREEIEARGLPAAFFKPILPGPYYLESDCPVTASLMRLEDSLINRDPLPVLQSKFPVPLCREFRSIAAGKRAFFRGPMPPTTLRSH